MNKQNYVLVPMNEIDPEARQIAVLWVENYEANGFDLPNKHKLASDIMNYAKAFHEKELKKLQSKKKVTKPYYHAQTVELTYLGFDVEVRGYFKKGEPAVNYPVDSAYPGSSDKFVIESVFCDEVELDKTLPDGTVIQWDALEEKVLDKIT